MVNENLKPVIENKKPFETVFELKNEFPSFEEFMKTYEGGNVNYDDLNGDSFGEVKGYGPCLDCSLEKWGIDFKVELRAEWGADHQYFFGIPLTETPKRSIDSFSSEAYDFIESVLTTSHSMSGIWQNGYMRIGIKLNWTSQAEELLRHFANGNLKVRGRGNVHHRGAENVIINTVRTALSDHRRGRSVNINREF